MRFKRGDHICALYSTTAELAQIVTGFLADGLRLGERCWYVASGDETDAIQGALHSLGVDVSECTARKSLRLISSDAAYVVHGDFNPEATMGIFNDAIGQRSADGFAGFRARGQRDCRALLWSLGLESSAQGKPVPPTLSPN